METKKLIEADLFRVYGCASKKVRIVNRILTESNPPLFCLKLFRKSRKRLFRFLYVHYSRKYAIEIPYGTQVGAGLYLPHNGRRTVNSECIIGKNVTIHPGVTLGKEVRGDRIGSPIIGDRVWIGANSTIVGGVKVGNDVLIAPGAYVNFNVKSDSIVLGNPGKIIDKEDAVSGYLKNIFDSSGDM